MLVKNNWITTNVQHMVKNPLDFAIKITRQKAEKLSFTEASKKAAWDIASLQKPIYLALSGGADSLHVFNTFASEGIKITPVITILKDNPTSKFETGYALKACKDTKIEPIIYELTESEHLKIYYNTVFTFLKSPGIWEVGAILAQQYAAGFKGITVTGDGVLPSYLSHGGSRLGKYEWDFYCDAFGEDFIPFYMWSPELSRALVSELPDDYTQLPVCIMKHMLYKTEYRPKVSGYYFDPQVRKISQDIMKMCKPNKNFFYLGTREQYLALFD